MTAQQDYNLAVASIIKIIVANNAGCVARLLRQYGYPTADKIPASELEATLFTVHCASPELFYSILSKCEWNHRNNNWTNSEQVSEQIVSCVQIHIQRQVDKTNWFKSVINHLQSQSNHYL